MDKVIIFGAGYHGRNAYYKLKAVADVICFVDNNPSLVGSKREGLPIMGAKDIMEIYGEGVDVVVCALQYLEIGAQLKKMGICEYYVLLDGFLYRCSSFEPMIPVELNQYTPYQKRTLDEKNIIFVQDSACIRTQRFAAVMKSQGYRVFLLCSRSNSMDGNRNYFAIFDEVFEFSTFRGIIRFLEDSEFDVIHSSNFPDTLTNIALMSSKPVVFDVHDMASIWRSVNTDAMFLEHRAITSSDGNIYTTEEAMKYAQRRYGLADRASIAVGNYVLDQIEISTPHEKLSSIDHEIHCVYEGTMSYDRDSDRYFENIWTKIAECGIHIHFYSHADPQYCVSLDQANPYFHYEGNIGSTKLMQEMTKYDCGLLVFNETHMNDFFMETASANKLFEYLNARLPIIVGSIKSYVSFINRYDVGIQVNFDRNVKEQIEVACKKKIDPDFLRKHRFTVQAHSTDLVSFYEKVIEHKGINHR